MQAFSAAAHIFAEGSFNSAKNVIRILSGDPDSIPPLKGN